MLRILLARLGARAKWNGFIVNSIVENRIHGLDLEKMGLRAVSLPILSTPRSRSSNLQFVQQFGDGEPVVGGDGFQHAAEEGASFQWSVVRHCDVMSASEAGCEANVGSLLAYTFISEHPQAADEVGTADVSRDLQTARASSRTKWSLMMPGIGPASPSPK